MNLTTEQVDVHMHYRVGIQKALNRNKGSALMSYPFVTKGKNCFASEQPLVCLPYVLYLLI